MILRKRMNDPEAITQFGLLSLVLGNIIHFFAHPAAKFWQGFADGMTGAAFAVALGCILMSALARRRQANA